MEAFHRERAPECREESEAGAAVSSAPPQPKASMHRQAIARDTERFVFRFIDRTQPPLLDGTDRIGQEPGREDDPTGPE